MSRLAVLLGCCLSLAQCLTPISLQDDTHHQPQLSENGRLPGSLDSVHYNLEIQPDIYTSAPPFSFNGSVQSIFECKSVTDTIVLNSADLTIQDGSLLVEVIEGDPDTNINVLSWQLVPELDFLEIVLSRDMVGGATYSVSVSFSGYLRTTSQSDGIYYDSYPVDGGVRYIMSSQLHAHNARHVFPSFDEPAMKATYDVTIVRKDHMISLTNTELLSEEQRGDGWVADHFATSPRMSAYLLCLIVCDFPHLDTYTSRGTLVRVFARQEVIEAAEYASSIAAPLLEWFEDWTGIPYPISKVDHIAVPNKGGAMENWGLITYGESNLLWKRDWFDSNNKRGTASVIAHELAHMWFGNLVTLDWWDDTWLNEGFASYFEAAPLSILGWTQTELTLNQRLLPMLVTDTRSTTSPIRPAIDTPWQALSAFTASQYLKGASVLRMIEQVLGANTFQAAIRNYLEEYAYSAAVTDQLWEAFTQQAALDGVTDTDGSPLIIKDKFDSWVDQRGYPLLEVTRDYDENTATLTQSHFNPDDNTMPPSPFEYKWNIPVSFTVERDSGLPVGAEVWLDQQTSVTIEDGIPPDRQWIVANPAKTGFYRVQYDSINLQNIGNELLENRIDIHVESRAALLNDVFTLARLGRNSETEFLMLTRYLNEETAGLPWISANSGFEYPISILARFPRTAELLKQYLTSLFSAPYAEIGWTEGENENIYTTLLRQLLIRLACTNDYSHCVTTCRTLFDAWRDNPNPHPVDVDQKVTVYCTSIEGGSSADWNLVHSRYLSPGASTLPSTIIERRALLQGLTCSLDTAILQNFIQLTFDPEQILPADASSALTTLARSKGGRWVLWEHVKENWRNNPFPAGVSRNSVLNAIVEGFATENDLVEFDAFVALYPPEGPQEENMYNSAREIVTSNKDWSDTNQQLIHAWLEAELSRRTNSI